MNKIPSATLTASQLKNLEKRDIVQIMSTMTLDEITQMTKETTPEYQQYSYLAGNGITISDASRKYNLPLPTLSRWAKRGIIAIIGKDKNRILLDEADVAYCAEIRKNNPGQGKWLFNPDGSPYMAKKDC